MQTILFKVIEATQIDHDWRTVDLNVEIDVRRDLYEQDLEARKKLHQRIVDNDYVETSEDGTEIDYSEFDFYGPDQIQADLDALRQWRNTSEGQNFISGIQSLAAYKLLEVGNTYLRDDIESAIHALSEGTLVSEL